MNYQGKYQIFDAGQIETYPLRTRTNKVKLHDLLAPESIDQKVFSVSGEIEHSLALIATKVVEHRKLGKPVVLFTGAHLIKNGLGRLLVDLVDRELLTCVSGNMATAIHDFELALIGETSEYVPQALEKGQFGMAYEFCYINEAIRVGNKEMLGLGEALGRTIHDEKFGREKLQNVMRPGAPDRFQHPDVSVLAACYRKDIPFTIHAGIGTDVIDQHPSFDGEAKGGCSGRDFLIYTKEIEKLYEGGVVLNVGSAVTGPEVFLKAASMTGNIQKVPRGIITADFDIRPFNKASIANESSVGYYNRDQKSIVVRVPEAYGGQGYNIEGNQRQTFPLLYKKIMERQREVG